MSGLRQHDYRPAPALEGLDDGGPCYFEGCGLHEYDPIHRDPADPADLARWLQDTFESQPAITIRWGVEPQVAWRALADELLRWQANPVFPEE